MDGEINKAETKVLKPPRRFKRLSSIIKYLYHRLSGKPRKTVKNIKERACYILYRENRTSSLDFCLSLILTQNTRNNYVLQSKNHNFSFVTEISNTPFLKTKNKSYRGLKSPGP